MAGDGTAGLRRGIGLSGSTFLAFNGTVGAGIFALPAVLHAFGAFGPWLVPIFAVLMLLIALPFVRLAAIYPVSGGPVAYVSPFGSAAMFQAGWLYYVARTTSIAANANVFATYAASVSSPLGTPIGRAATLLLLIGAMTVINIVGIRRAVRALDLLTLLKAAPLVGLAVWALVEAGGTLPPPGPPPAFSAVEASALVILYAFFGFENAVIPADETVNPTRTIPRALLVTLASAAALYFLIQLAFLAVMPAGAAPEAPLAALAETLMGPAGAILISATALASIAGNVTSALLSTPRLTYALARDGLLPHWFGAVNPRFATPANSILFMGVLAALLALTGSFAWLAVVSALARIFVFAGSIAALPPALRTLHLRSGLATMAQVGAGLAVCLWAISQAEGRAWAMLAGLFGVGLVLFAVARRQAGSSSAATVASIQPPPSTRLP